MNKAAIDYLIEQIKVRPWKSNCWDMHADCMVGIFAWAQDGRRIGPGDDCRFTFQKALGLTDMQGVALYVMGTHYDRSEHCLNVPFDARHRFTEQSAEKQNADLIVMLSNLRDTGDVIWPPV